MGFQNLGMGERVKRRRVKVHFLMLIVSFGKRMPKGKPIAPKAMFGD